MDARNLRSGPTDSKKNWILRDSYLPRTVFYEIGIVGALGTVGFQKR